MTLDELKAQKIWFLWNYAPGKNGKMTKVPMSAKGSVTGSSDNYLDIWVDYNDALFAKEKYNTSWIGFVVPDDMYFLDIDGRPLDDSFVQLLLERHDTYAEMSPSGNGIHILGSCDNDSLPFIWDEAKGRVSVAREFYQKNPNNHIELYFGHATNRCASFIGNAINGKDLTDGTAARLTTLDKDMRRKPKINYSESWDGDKEDFDIICSLRKQKNGEKFSKIRLVKKYTDVQELNAEIIKEFVDKIYIYKAERIGDKKVQHIKILWNCIGEFIPPVKEKNGVATPTWLHRYFLTNAPVAFVFRDRKSLCGTTFSQPLFYSRKFGMKLSEAASPSCMKPFVRPCCRA